MLPPRRLTAVGLIALVILLGLNFFVVELERHSNKQEVVDATATPAHIEGVFSGNSLTEIGVNIHVFAQNWPTPAVFLNCGLGDTTSVEHCVVLRQALHRHPEARFVEYGFAGLQLTDVPNGSWSELKGRRTVSYYLEPELASRLYGSSKLDQLRFEYIRYLPLAAERYLLWNRVELLRRSLQDIGQSSSPTNRFGRASDFQSLENLWSSGVLEEGLSAVEKNKPLSAAVTELIRSGHDGGRPVFMVEMPMPPAYESAVVQTDAWQKYRAYVRTRVEQAGGQYIDAHDWVTDPAEFLDAVHLNPAGADRFSARLAKTIAPLVH